jgi:hypothetical protein
MNKLGFWTTLGAAVAVTGLILPASAAASSGGTVLVATGTVLGASGTAMPGATVDLYAWPPDAVMSKLKIGQAVPEKLIATGKASASGKFSLSVSPSSLTAMENTAGYTNLEAESGGASWSFPVKAADPKPVSVILKGARLYACGDFFYYKYAKHPYATLEWGIIRKGGHTRGDVIKFSYQESQSSSLGVEYSPDGDAGTYRADGTDSSVSTSGEDFTKVRKPESVAFRTQFFAGLFRQECYASGPGPALTAQAKRKPKCEHKNWCVCPPRPGGDTCHFEVHSNGWWGGAKNFLLKGAPRYHRSRCEFQQAGSAYATTKQAARVYVNGWYLPLLGLGASAQTGYDAQAKLTYSFGSTGHVCSTNLQAPVNSPLVETVGGK